MPQYRPRTANIPHAKVVADVVPWLFPRHRCAAAGRTRLILAGLWTETCVALPAIQALEDGYEVYIVEDCCGDISALAHENAMQRMIQAGARPVTALSVMLEWQRDWALLDTSDAVRELAQAHSSVHGGLTEAAAPPHRKPPQPVYPGYVFQAAE